MDTVLIYLAGWLLLVTPLDFLISVWTGGAFLPIWALGTLVYFLTCAILTAMRW